LSGRVSQHLRPICATAGTQLAEAITAEKLNENGVSCRHFILPHAKASAKRKQPATNVSHGDAIDTDSEDETYADPVSEGGCDDDSPDSSDDDIEIGNGEVWIILP